MFMMPVITLLATVMDPHAAALQYLRTHRSKLDSSIDLSSAVRLALEAREASAWARAVPWDVFCDAVLPVACLDEPRDEWREKLYPICSELVRDSRSTKEAAIKLNGAIWETLDVRYEPGLSPAYLAPLSVIAHGRASCSGLSLLLTACCRSVGLPARVAGIADWGDGSGNHAWVEVWCPDGWHSLGACEPTDLDDTWFAERLRGANAPRVFASSFRWIPVEGRPCSFPLPWSSPSASPRTCEEGALDDMDKKGRDEATTELQIPAVEVTSRYRAL